MSFREKTSAPSKSLPGRSFINPLDEQHENRDFGHRYLDGDGHSVARNDLLYEIRLGRFAFCRLAAFRGRPNVAGKAESAPDGK